MDLLDDILLDKAVYWSPTGSDAHGKTVFDTPVQLDVRWSDVQQLFENAKGEQRVSKAVVFVRQDLKLDGALWHGTLTNVADRNDPFRNKGCWQIQSAVKVPTIDYDDYLRVVIL